MKPRAQFTPCLQPQGAAPLLSPSLPSPLTWAFQAPFPSIPTSLFFLDFLLLCFILPIPTLSVVTGASDASALSRGDSPSSVPFLTLFPGLSRLSYNVGTGRGAGLSPHT
jgi:hypothetical protein